MAISDTERREIARKLREIEGRTTSELTDGELLDLLADKVRFGRYGSKNFDEGLFGRIAELIDRPTCHDDDEREQYPVYTDWLFKCSYCGWDGQIWKSVGSGDMSSCVTNYCPNCGEGAL